MVRHLYDWIMRLSAHDKAPQALFCVAFAESSFFPVPPDVMLVPMILARRRKAWLYASICTVASVAGGIVSYAIGYFLFDSMGEPILKFYGHEESFEDATRLFNEWGMWVLIAKGLAPFPYKVLAIAAGASELGVGSFILASIVSRATRFYLVAALLFWFGAAARDYIERRLNVLTILFVLLVGGVVAIKYVL